MEDNNNIQFSQKFKINKFLNQYNLLTKVKREKHVW